MSDPARIFIGCDPNDCDLEQMMVLEYSLRKHSSIPLQIHWMQLSRDPSSPWHASPATAEGWNTSRWATPFSGFRWAIPALCGFEGRAIYMDADMLVLHDIAALWNAPIPPGKVMIAKGRKQRWRFCVTVWDCAAARAHLPPLAELKREPTAHKERTRYFSEHPELIQPLDPNFNNVDGEEQPIEQIRVLHYSDMGTQFSHRYAFARLAGSEQRHWFDGEVLNHPRSDLQALFDRYYGEALANGYTLDQYRVAEPFGAFAKATQIDYQGNKRTRRVSMWSKLKSRLKWGMPARQENARRAADEMEGRRP